MRPDGEFARPVAGTSLAACWRAKSASVPTFGMLASHVGQWDPFETCWSGFQDLTVLLLGTAIVISRSLP